MDTDRRLHYLKRQLPYNYCVRFMWGESQIIPVEKTTMGFAPSHYLEKPIYQTVIDYCKVDKNFYVTPIVQDVRVSLTISIENNPVIHIQETSTEVYGAFNQGILWGDQTELSSVKNDKHSVLNQELFIGFHNMYFMLSAKKASRHNIQFWLRLFFIKAPVHLSQRIAK